MDIINIIPSYLKVVQDYKWFVGGFIVLFYIYSFKTSSNVINTNTVNNNSNSRLILLLLISYYFRNNIMKMLYGNKKQEINNYNEPYDNNENVIYKYGSYHVTTHQKTQYFERNPNRLWKIIKKYRSTSPEIVKDIYYNLQNFQSEIKALKEKNGYLHQHFDKLVDRKIEIMNLLESLEYTENVDMSQLKEEVSSFLKNALHEARSKVTSDRINSSNGLIHIDDDVYAIS